jgi:hypothetical protein
MNHNPRPVRSSGTTLALAGALGALLMSTVGLLAALQFPSQRFQDFSPWRMLKFLVTLITPLQAFEFSAWVVITGVLIAAGSRRVPINRSRALAAFAAGALVPIGLVLLGHSLSKFWPNTTGPTDAPLMALLLALYSLGMPWLLGHLIRRIPASPPFTPTAD